MEEKHLDNKECPFCGSEEVYLGYGFAGGPLGFYEVCLNCDKFLEVYPDKELIDE